MSKSHLEGKVGLFVFVGLVLLAGLLIQFSKGSSFFRPAYKIYLRAPSVGGLKPRSAVLMAGVQVGTVSGINLGPHGTNVTLTLKIYRQYEIHKDAQFVIEQSGFLGDQYVAITPTQNEGDVFRDGDIAETIAPFNLQEVARAAGGFIQRIDETAKKLNAAIVDVRKYVLNEQTLTNLSTAAINLRVVSEHASSAIDGLNFVVQTNGAGISVAISNLVFFSDSINDFAGGLSGVLNSNAPQITSAVKNIESSTIILKNVLEDVQTGKGLAGTLIRNEELAANVSLIVSNLSVTSSNLNRLGLWGVLWQHKPPRESEASHFQDLPSPKGRSE